MASVILTAGATAATAGATTGVAFAATTGATLLGAYLDSKIFAPEDTRSRNPGSRLSDVQIQGATINTPIPRLFGRAKIAGNVIWATEFDEDIIRTEQSQSTGNKKDEQTHTTELTDFKYDMSLAIAICEGPIHGITRIWVNGDEWVPTSEFEIFIGDPDQPVSDTIRKLHESKDRTHTDGDSDFPNYAGISYIVFKDLPLKYLGNTPPNMEFEVIKRPRDLVSPEKDSTIWGQADSLMIDLNGGNFSLFDHVLIRNDEVVYG